jgi:Beta-lactamase superfamily domain
MSLTVTHINADSTFLLVFRPAAAAAPAFPPSPGRSPGSFSILLDPWLVGESTIISSLFSVARHTTPACISSLRDLPSPPDLVLISQEKPDHCHEETLRQLDPGSKNSDNTLSKSPLILAEPNAAKRIRSWKHFSPDCVQALERWEPNSNKENNIRRLPIPASSPLGRPGEVSIAFIPNKWDLSGLHNAIGITYRPPSTRHALGDSSITPPASPLLSPASATPLQTSTSYAAIQDRTISVIYSPHGVSYSLLQPYASQHLVKEAALPLTLLLHSFDRVQSPWWLGGNVSAGSPGGVEIARNLQTRCWISAHDEVKDLRGIVIPYMRTRVYTREEVEALVGMEDTEKGRGIKSEILILDAGQNWSFGPA